MRSERAFCERLNYDMLFKWSLDLPIDAADECFAAVVHQAKLRRYISSDHFSVDGTLLEAWAAHKSFNPKDADTDRDDCPKGRITEVGWHGRQRRTTRTRRRRILRLGCIAGRATGHLLIEHPFALIVDAELTAATG